MRNWTNRLKGKQAKKLKKQEKMIRTHIFSMRTWLTLLIGKLESAPKKTEQQLRREREIERQELMDKVAQLESEGTFW